ncbi:hypothetical protein [Agrobacterium larrymoorei]|uniref:Uncharacterized protein n=1 Tax=Agrobacterium larrymoorei TaxID=160699 RepID=A0A4D7DR03_9HYPH|nr:hypothetical protein [Agrobacterium larrymoorei]QCI98798.1 hypothetical protein CFBP5473_13365 [Agrobacterium larrymoorei]QYA08316.1 hypothetical protein J5285_06375 [Agrobacterium larrymoorei]
MGGSRDAIDKLPFPSVWLTVREHHRDDWEIRLRPAANLIGYFLFPVGWHWSEFKALTDADKMPYEGMAREASNQEIPLKRPLMKPASVRYRAAGDHRRNVVHSFLQKILVRGDVRYFHGPMRNIALPHRGSQPVNRPLARDDFEEVRIANSTVGRMISRQIDVKVDAKDLIEHLIRQNETRGAPPAYDLNKIERWCRDQLERNAVLKDMTGELSATLINAASDWQGKIFTKPAGPDQIRPIVTRLLREYVNEE